MTTLSGKGSGKLSVLSIAGRREIRYNRYDLFEGITYFQSDFRGERNEYPADPEQNHPHPAAVRYAGRALRRLPAAAPGERPGGDPWHQPHPAAGHPGLPGAGGLYHPPPRRGHHHQPPRAERSHPDGHRGGIPGHDPAERLHPSGGLHPLLGGAGGREDRRPAPAPGGNAHAPGLPALHRRRPPRHLLRGSAGKGPDPGRTTQRRT